MKTIIRRIRLVEKTGEERGKERRRPGKSVEETRREEKRREEKRREERRRE